jgi:hypothetical protein
MFLNGLPFVVMLLTPCGTPDAQGHTCMMTSHISSEHAAVTEFTSRVDRYMNLRWMLEASLGPDTLCADPEETQRAHTNLANAIRAERASARTGDLFTPAVAGFFRRQISAALRESGRELRTSLEDPTTGMPIDLPSVEVNGMLPWGAGERLWPSLMKTLPDLPAELDYQLVGRDLVLLDVSLNIVVDILERVDGTPTQATGRLDPRHRSRSH